MRVRRHTASIMPATIQTRCDAIVTGADQRRKNGMQSRTHNPIDRPSTISRRAGGRVPHPGGGARLALPVGQLSITRGGAHLFVTSPPSRARRLAGRLRPRTTWRWPSADSKTIHRADRRTDRSGRCTSADDDRTPSPSTS